MWCADADNCKVLVGWLWNCHDIGILTGYVWIAVLDFEQGTKSHQIKTAHLGGLLQGFLFLNFGRHVFQCYFDFLAHLVCYNHVQYNAVKYQCYAVE